MPTAEDFMVEAEQLLNETDEATSLEEKRLLLQKAQVYATLAVAFRSA